MQITFSTWIYASPTSNKCAVYYILQYFSFGTQPSLNGAVAHNRAQNRLEHTTEQAVHTTEPTWFANKRCVRIAYIGNLSISKSCKYTSHILHTFFKQYASLTTLSMSPYCPLTLIGCLLFSFEMRHTTEPRCSVVCVYTARLCAGRLGGVECHPCVNIFCILFSAIPDILC